MSSELKINSNILSALGFGTDKWTYSLAVAAPSEVSQQTWVFACDSHYIVASAESGSTKGGPYHIDRHGNQRDDGNLPDICGKVGEILGQKRQWVTLNFCDLTRIVDAIRVKDAKEPAYIHVGIGGPDDALALMVRGYEAFAVLMPCLPLESHSLGHIFHLRAAAAVTPMVKENGDE